MTEGIVATSVWLLALLMIVTVNPPHRAAAIGNRRQAALGGAALAALALFVAAWLSGPLLDALDISKPNVQIAAGLLIAVIGLIELVRGLPKEAPVPESAVSGAALVAFPILLRPEVTLLTVSIAAHRGVWPAAAMVVVALGLSVLAIGRDGGGVASFLAGGVGRAFAVLAVAGAIDLIVDGVFDI